MNKCIMSAIFLFSLHLLSWLHDFSPLVWWIYKWMLHSQDMTDLVMTYCLFIHCHIWFVNFLAFFSFIHNHLPIGTILILSLSGFTVKFMLGFSNEMRIMHFSYILNSSIVYNMDQNNSSLDCVIEFIFAKYLGLVSFSLLLWENIVFLIYCF